MNKEKIYLLPGLMTNHKLWSKILPLLEDDFDLIHVPLPLCENFDEASKTLENIFKEEKINLLGFSLGAYLASFFTVKNPHRVKRLFLIAGTPFGLHEKEQEKRESIIKQMHSLEINTISKKKIQSLLDKKNIENLELISLIKEMFMDLGKDVYKIQMASTFNRTDLSKSFANLDISIKFLYSKGDVLLNHKLLNKLKNKQKNILFEEFLGSSHMLPLEEESFLSKEIKKWID